MEEKKEGRTRYVGLRLTAPEFKEVDKKWRESTLRRLSDYIRHVLFNRSVTAYTRNRSLDEFMAEMIVLRRELNAIGVNFNQAVHRLHTLDHAPQMIDWLARFERDRELFFEQIDAIRLRMDCIADEWLQ